VTPARVLLTVDAVGGIWQYATELARALSEHGTETVLALLGPPPSPARRAAAEAIPGARLIDTGLPLDWLADDAASVAQSGSRLAELAGDLRADIAQINMPALAADARFAMPVVAVAHSCVATWWAAAEEGPAPAAFRWRTQLTARGLRAADRVVAPSAAFADAIMAAYHLRTRPAVVHNGRTAPTARPRVMHDRALTAGRLWDGGKNVAVLDRAAAALHIPFEAAGAIAGPNGERVTLRHLHVLGLLDEAALGPPPRRPPGVRVGGALRALRSRGAGSRRRRLRARPLRHSNLSRTVERGRPVRRTRRRRRLCGRDHRRDRRRAPPPRARPGRPVARSRLHACGDGRRHAHNLSRGGAPRRRQHPRRGLSVSSMRIVYFTHSLASCWNHGNAHFLRGVLSELATRGHDVVALEPAGAWSLANLLADHGEAGLDAYRRAYPDLASTTFDPAARDRALGRRRRPRPDARMERPRAGRRTRPHPPRGRDFPAPVPRHPSPRGQRSGSDPRL
jgi:hypothetical protein